MLNSPSSSVDIIGRPGTPHSGNDLTGIKDNHVYILTRDGRGSNIHIFDISDLENPDLVKGVKVSDNNDEHARIGIHLVDESWGFGAPVARRICSDRADQEHGIGCNCGCGSESIRFAVSSGSQPHGRRR